MKYEPLGVNFEDSQFVEQAKLSTLSISRLFKVPSNRLNVTEGSQSFASAEQANIMYYVSCIRPILDKLEHELNYKLWQESERDNYYVEFNPASLLRGDQASQDASYKAGVDGGWLSTNIIKKKMNLPPIQGGDYHYRPLNMAIIEHDIPKVGTEENTKDVTETKSLDLSELYQDAIYRIQTKEIKAIERAAKKYDSEEFAIWVTEFYDKHKATVAETLAPVSRADNRADQIETVAEQHCKKHLCQLAGAEGNYERITKQWRTIEGSEELRNTIIAC